jgi:hypothetical protein
MYARSGVILVGCCIRASVGGHRMSGFCLADKRQLLAVRAALRLARRPAPAADLPQYFPLFS